MQLWNLFSFPNMKINSLLRYSTFYTFFTVQDNNEIKDMEIDFEI